MGEFREFRTQDDGSGASREFRNSQRSPGGGGGKKNRKKEEKKAGRGRKKKWEEEKENVGKKTDLKEKKIRKDQNFMENFKE